MDDEAALRARQVALAASAWLGAPADHEAYRRLVEAVEGWDDYCAPQLAEPVEELLDDVGADRPPVPLSEATDEVVAQLRKTARRIL